MQTLDGHHHVHLLYILYMSSVSESCHKQAVLVLLPITFSTDMKGFLGRIYFLCFLSCLMLVRQSLMPGVADTLAYNSVSAFRQDPNGTYTIVTIWNHICIVNLASNGRESYNALFSILR